MSESETPNLDDSFPCDFTIKVMGKPRDTFEPEITEIVKAEFPAFKLKAQPSKNGKYVSLSYAVYAESRVKLDVVYKAISARDDVLMAL